MITAHGWNAFDGAISGFDSALANRRFRLWPRTARAGASSTHSIRFARSVATLPPLPRSGCFYLDPPPNWLSTWCRNATLWHCT